MNLLTYTYLAYLALSAVVTIWVAQTLHFRGRLFLVKNFHGDELLADSVNHLLVVGFYLLNFGYVTLALKYGDKPTDLQTAVEFLATKVGLVLVILGTMHFFNLYVFWFFFIDRRNNRFIHLFNRLCHWWSRVAHLSANPRQNLVRICHAVRQSHFFQTAE